MFFIPDLNNFYYKKNQNWKLLQLPYEGDNLLVDCNIEFSKFLYYCTTACACDFLNLTLYFSIP